MNDPAKYVKLFWLLLLSVIAVLGAMVLIFLGLRLVFGFVNELSWFTYVFALFVLSVPPAIFITAFIIYWVRTRAHPSTVARMVSYVIFALFLSAWLIQFSRDLISFFTMKLTPAVDYKSWDMVFIASSIAALFIVGIIQAFSSAKEEDWMERNKRLGDNRN